MTQLRILAVVFLAAGCAGSSSPSGRVDLIPSNWEIVSVSGTKVEGDAPRILVIGRSSSARVELGCGEIDLRYTGDTDGSALSFDEQRVAEGCQGSTDGQDTAIRSAIGNVEAWRVLTDTSIELLDDGGHALLSLQATTCDCPHQPPGTGRPTPS